LQFAMLLDDAANSVYDPVHRSFGCGETPERYMSQTLSDYWINSSHNTYLTGDQLQGHSASEQYAFVLQRGCRCIELDCWDGSKDIPHGNSGDEPIITHGHTLCTKIFFRDVIHAINDSAFSPPANNPFPVILSIEMHCSGRFQDRMYQHCTEIFGDKLLLLQDSDTEMALLPSPWELRNKIIIKGKRAQDNSVSAEDSSSDDGSDPDDDGQITEKTIKAKEKEKKVAEQAQKKEEGTSRGSKKSGSGAEEGPVIEKKTKGSAKWASIIYLVAVHFKSFKTPGKPYEMSSFAEGKTKKLATIQREEFLRYNYRQLARVYPAAHRIASDNLDPIAAWASGCQLVALNFQTGDNPMWLNFWRFRENNSTGYVLKPPYMRGTAPKLLPIRLTVVILSLQRLPNKTASSDILDPFVQIELTGPGKDVEITRTATVTDNGFNAVFGGGRGEAFEFDTQEREVSMLKISVFDEDPMQVTLVGQSALPITAIRPGYRHVALHDVSNGAIRYAGVLAKFAIEYI